MMKHRGNKISMHLNDLLKSRRQERIVFHWFRLGDLRLHDNATLFRAAEAAYDSRLAERRKRSPPKDDPCYIVPIFCFDSKLFGNEALTPSGDLRMNPRRAKFILESVIDLRKQLENEHGSKLAVAYGEPKDVFEKIIHQIDISIPIEIFCQDEPIREGRLTARQVNGLVIQNRKGSGVTTVWDSSLYDPKYIHYGGKNVPELPPDMDEFRKQIESRGKIRHPIYPIPKYLLYPESDSKFYDLFNDMTTYMPTLKDLGYTDEQIENAGRDDPRSAIALLRGGETAAIERLNEYFWHRDMLKAAYTTKDGMIGLDYSSKLSPYLAHGCISPKFILEEIKRYRNSRISNMSTFWYEFELMKRDFCKLFFVKNGEKVFLPGGPIGKVDKVWTTDMDQLNAWKEGMTGYPLVDACMRELKTTGYMSKLGRRITAYFLTYHLAHDWRNGGDWFESQLLDHCVYSNWVVSFCFVVNVY
jgi:deoxyribodipyrimidine photo-lyase